MFFNVPNDDDVDVLAAIASVAGCVGIYFVLCVLPRLFSSDFA